MIQSMNVNNQYDIVIVGGGLVGATLALCLGRSRWRVCLLEAGQTGMPQSTEFDGRHLALSNLTLAALKRLSVIPGDQQELTNIEAIHVSRIGDFAHSLLSAKRLGLRSFGAVIPASLLAQYFETALLTDGKIERLVGARVTDVQPLHSADYAEVVYQHNGKSLTLEARLVVAADGSESSIGKILQLSEVVKDYGQSAVVCNVGVSKPQPGFAFERMTAAGPIAFLPQKNSRYGVVWSQLKESADRRLLVSNDEFIMQLQEAFGFRLGRISSPGKRQIWPLLSRRLECCFAQRSIFVGNAAQTVHPVGAQGFNLGLRDALALTQMLAEIDHDDPCANDLPRSFSERRAGDRVQVAKLTDEILQNSMSDNGVMPWLRASGALAIDASIDLQWKIVEQGTGMRHRALLAAIA
jgi:2-octaprenyl-6-methoxyphenol hydroxylase